MTKTKRILLIGNPNVGKSTIFSRLTGAKVIVSNYPGTTVEYYQGYFKLEDKEAIIIDAPGIYNLEPSSKAEEVAKELIDGADIIVNVMDATNLERNLYLTLQLLETNKPIVVVLNIWDETKHKGIEIDCQKMEEILKVPVVATSGISGEGIRKLAFRIWEAKTSSFVAEDKWKSIGFILQNVQKLYHKHHTLLEILGEVSIRPLTGFFIAAVVIFISFTLVRFIGENLISYIFDPFFNKLWLPLLVKIDSLLKGGGILHSILIGHLIGGEVDFVQSFGLLSTGLYVPLAMVLPYIIGFYLVLGFWEDFGYLPRLAVLMDNFMHRLGLHGYSIFPFILGLGCNVPGAMATRLLASRREKFITATLMAIAVPCMAQIAMIVGLLGKRGGQYVFLVFFILLLIFIIKGLILNKLMPGHSPEILMEVPPYRLPRWDVTLKKLWMRMSGFLKEALPLVLLGVIAVNLLYSLGIIKAIASLLSPFLVKIWGLPKESVAALIIGFLRKDVAVGMLGPLGLTTKQLIVGSVILAIYFPCIATFVVLTKELGWRDMLKSVIIMIFVTFSVGALLNLIL